MFSHFFPKKLKKTGISQSYKFWRQTIWREKWVNSPCFQVSMQILKIEQELWSVVKFQVAWSDQAEEIYGRYFDPFPRNFSHNWIATPVYLGSHGVFYLL
jgi:hypothetical protein